MPLSEKSPDPVASTSASAASGLPAPAPAAAKKGKRKADKDKDEEGSHSGTGTPTQKRSRVHFSCVECNRRKQKCDRQSPCGHCLARKIPHLCRPFINGVEDPAVVEADVRARLDRIENLLSGLVSETRNGGTTSSSGDVKRLRVLSSPLPILKLGAGDSPDDPMRNGGETTGDEGGDEDDEDGPTGTLRGGRFYGPSAMSSVSSSRMSRILSSFPSNTFGAPPPNQLPSSSSRQRANHRAASPYALQGQPLPPPLEDALNTLDESGIGLDNIVALMNKLPAREMREALVGLYWREIDWTRYHIYQPAFQSRYMAFFAHETSGNPVHTNIPYPIRSLEANGLKWLPLLFIMMAIATLTAPLSLFGDEETRRVWSRSLYGSARKAMNIAQALQRDNLDIVMAGLLIGRYLLLVRRAAEGFTPLTTALQLGLYRDGTHLGIEDAREVELRRRVWSSVYHHDRSQSLLVGRPCLISDSSCDTKPPANLEDLDLDLISEFPPGGRPMSQPTTMTYTVLRHSLAVIMGKISQRIFSLSHPSYNTVVEIDQELIEWKHNLPSYFKLENPDRSMDAKYHFLAFHRQILAAEFYATRITLHRPYMLRKRDSQLYEYSRKAAVEAARADLTSRRDFQLNKPAHLNYRLSLGSYWLLNSYIIIGIALLLDPTSTQADELRNLLNVVTGRAPDQDGRVSMATVRELAIVELFTHRRSHDDPISAPGSPTSSMSALPRQSNAPYLPSFAGQRSIINQDFLSPNATSVANQPLEPGLWGQVDPVDQLLLSYHRQRDALNANTAAQHAAAVQQQQPPQQQPPVDSAWSARAVGMGDHSVQRPFSDAGGEDDGASSNGGNGPPPPRVDDRGTYLTPQGGSQYGGARDGGGRGPLSGGEPHGTGVYPGGNNGPNDFTTPWSHGYQAFSSAGGGSGFGSEEGGVGELLGDAKEVAFLNSLISAISSGDGPMAA